MSWLNDSIPERDPNPPDKLYHSDFRAMTSDSGYWSSDEAYWLQYVILDLESDVSDEEVYIKQKYG